MARLTARLAARLEARLAACLAAPLVTRFATVQRPRSTVQRRLSGQWRLVPRPIAAATERPRSAASLRAGYRSASGARPRHDLGYGPGYGAEYGADYGPGYGPGYGAEYGADYIWSRLRRWVRR